MEMESDAFDELDLGLLDALEVNGRASFSRIGAVLGVSDQTVARRYRRLCAEGGLRVVAVRDAERLGQDQGGVVRTHMHALTVTFLQDH